MLVSATATPDDPFYSLSDNIFVERYDESEEFLPIMQNAYEECFLISSMPIAEKLERKKLSRMRVQIQFRDIEQRINLTHVDDDTCQHQTALLYLNDTDGDTVIYENKYDFNSGYDAITYLEKVIGGEENLVEMERVSPKPNRLIFFNGEHYHSSSTPTKTQIRAVVNYNFI